MTTMFLTRSSRTSRASPPAVIAQLTSSAMPGTINTPRIERRRSSSYSGGGMGQVRSIAACTAGPAPFRRAACANGSGPPDSVNHSGGPQHDDRADDRQQEARGMKHRPIGRLREQTGDEAADDRADDAETGRHPEAHGV